MILQLKIVTYVKYECTKYIRCTKTETFSSIYWCAYRKLCKPAYIYKKTLVHVYNFVFNLTTVEPNLTCRQHDGHYGHRFNLFLTV